MKIKERKINADYRINAQAPLSLSLTTKKVKFKKKLNTKEKRKITGYLILVLNKRNTSNYRPKNKKKEIPPKKTQTKSKKKQK
jgi:hypothetical protein